MPKKKKRLKMPQYNIAELEFQFQIPFKDSVETFLKHYTTIQECISDEVVVPIQIRKCCLDENCGIFRMTSKVKTAPKQNTTILSNKEEEQLINLSIKKESEIHEPLAPNLFGVSQRDFDYMFGLLLGVFIQTENYHWDTLKFTGQSYVKQVAKSVFLNPNAIPLDWTQAKIRGLTSKEIIAPQTHKNH